MSWPHGGDVLSGGLFRHDIGAFGVVTVLSGHDRGADRIDDYRGLFWHRPWSAGVFTAMLLSLAGIPP
ncbi:MAG TPA: proton-conducting transporter membrane subunit [Anaerolineae bacterium]|nr:proton-conducting transporter membrane subunit [Anaerolineae bacterium]